MLDMSSIVSITYELEGDGLPQLLAFQRVEGFRTLGQNLNSDTTLRNVDALLRKTRNLALGMIIKKNWPGHGICEGKITATDQAESTLYPGQVRTVYTVKYDIDGAEEDLEEEEVRPVLVVTQSVERSEVLQGLRPAFHYLDNRLTGNCQSNYSCENTYTLFRLFQAFDP